ncbi:MAG: sensor histidine kinase, partial [Oliverpabstia sp.]
MKEERKKKYWIQNIKPKSMKMTSVFVILPLGITLLGLIFFNMISLYESNMLVKRYIADTANLYVEQINLDVVQINNELIYMIDQNENIQNLPSEVTSRDAKYYGLERDIKENNRIMNIRYREVQNFYVYGQEADVLILENGVIFSESQKTPLYQVITEYLSNVEADSLSTRWIIMQAEGKDYIVSWYSKDKKVVGCIIDVDTIYSILRDKVENYQITPLLTDREGNAILASYGKSVEKKIMNVEPDASYPFGGVGTMHFFITSNEGILEKLLNLQIIFIIVLLVIIVLGFLTIYSYYKRILEPMESFVNGLENMEENQILNDNGTNNLIELESASDKFRDLLRKIQSLKIEIYEKELEKQKAELEYVQEQLRPHFFL